jgi:hypothetical protein
MASHEEGQAMTWKPEVQTAGGGAKWTGNSLVFEEKEDAEAWVLGLMMRWTAVSDTRVVESEEEPNR